MAKHHIIISGTGRAGTTFLIQLFTVLGFPTGFSDITSKVHSNCNAGMEWDIRRKDAPYIAKSPWICDYLDSVLEGNDVVIEHAIIPVRDLFSAAESRRDVTKRTDASFYEGKFKAIPGGLWHTSEPQEQETILTHQLYKLIHALAKHNIPLTLLYFPRLIHDSVYLYEKLDFMLEEIEYETFSTVFNEVARPDLIHSYKP